MNVETLARRPLGRSGIEMPVLGIGAWMMGSTDKDYWGGQDMDDAASMVDRALDLGANYFDVAEAYNEGRTEEALGRLLKGRRSEAIIGSKILPQHCTPAGIREHLEATLRRLDTDYVDIYMIHWPIRDHSLAEALVALDEHRRAGRIRAIGISNYGPRDLAEAVAVGVPIAVNQLHYNLLSRAIEAEILPLCRQHGIGVTTYMPLLQGILTCKYATIDEVPYMRTRTRHFASTRKESRHGEPGAEAEVAAVLDGLRAIAAELGTTPGRVALAWCAATPGITTVIAGARDADQLEENMVGIATPLSASVLERLDALTRPLWRKLGDNADYWMTAAQSRIR